jgi:hypothetical protein
MQDLVIEFAGCQDESCAPPVEDLGGLAEAAVPGFEFVHELPVGLTASAVSVLEFYSSDQPRDSAGRWTKSGGNGRAKKDWEGERPFGGDNVSMFYHVLPKWIARGSDYENSNGAISIPERLEQAARELYQDDKWDLGYDVPLYDIAYTLGYSVPRDRKRIVEALSAGAPSPKQQVVLEILRQVHQEMADELAAGGFDSVHLGRVSADTSPFRTEAKRWTSMSMSEPGPSLVPGLTSWSLTPTNNAEKDWADEFPNPEDAKNYVYDIPAERVLGRGGLISDEVLVADDSRMIEALMASRDSVELRGVAVYPISTFAEREDAGAPVVRAAGVLEFYSPDQPRDDEGKWTSDSGGGGKKVFKLEPGVKVFDDDRQSKRAIELLTGNPRFKDQVERALRGESSDLDDIVAVDRYDPDRYDLEGWVHDLEESTGIAIVGASSAARILVCETLFNGEGAKASGSVTPAEFEKADGPLIDVIAQGVIARMGSEWRSGLNSVDTGLKSQMQQAASFQFDVPWDNPASVVPNGTVAAAIDAVYRSTQEEFKLGGYTHVQIYRGLSFGSGPKGLVKSRETESAITASGKVRGNPMSSWSLFESVAKFFQTARYHGILLSSTVPVSEVLSYHGKGGFGSGAEREVILTGGEIPTSIVGVSKDDYVPSAWHEMGAVEAVEFYSPDQPRDKEGQWTRVGGGGLSIVKSGKVTPKLEAESEEWNTGTDVLGDRLVREEEAHIQAIGFELAKDPAFREVVDRYASGQGTDLTRDVLGYQKTPDGYMIDSSLDSLRILSKIGLQQAAGIDAETLDPITAAAAAWVMLKVSRGRDDEITDGPYSLGSDHSVLNVDLLGEWAKMDRYQIAACGVTSLFQHSWATWQDGSDFTAPGALMKVVSEEFGLTGSHHYEIQEYRPSADFRTVGRAFVRAQYEYTQSRLRERGVEQLVVHRGMRVPKDRIDSFFEANAIENNPLSSWTTNFYTAQQFANALTGDKAPIQYRAVVPREAVFSMGRFGFGSYEEDEVVVVSRRIEGIEPWMSSRSDEFAPSDESTVYGDEDEENARWIGWKRWSTVTASGEQEFRFNPSQPRDAEGRWTDGPVRGSGKSPTENREAMLSTMDEFEFGSKKFAGAGSSPHLSGAIESKVNGSVRVGKKLAADPAFRAWVDSFEDSDALRAVLVDRQYNELAMDGGVTSSGGTLDLLAAGWNGQGRSGTGRLMRDGLTLDRIAEESGLSKYEVVGRAIGERLNNAQMHWCGGSGDPLSYSVQHAVHAEFGAGEMADYVREPRLKYGAAGAEYIRDPGVMRVVGMAVRSRYEATQDLFGELGYGSGDVVRIYRGMSVYEDDHPLLTRANGSKLAMNPLSSWTVNKGESRNWGDTVFRADVPVSQIYSLGMDGVGCLREREVVLLGYPIETHHMSDRDASYASQGWADFSVVSELELACHDASCAPPPVGTGGSKPGAGEGGGGDFDLDAWYEQFGYSAELRGGKDPDQYERWAAENKENTLELGADKVQALGPVIADAVEKRGVRICVNPDAVRSIILSGRFKSQHETGGSMGAYAPDVRRNAEGWMFGWSPDDPKTAPIYGYVPVPGTQPTFYYGRVVVQLTPEASRRATFTIGDSLGSARPLPVERARDATAEEIAGAAATHFAPKAWIRDGRLSYGSYVEAQIHGGVRLKDIEAVYWDETSDMGRVSPVPEDRARELAAALGKEATKLENLVDEGAS